MQVVGGMLRIGGLVVASLSVILLANAALAAPPASIDWLLQPSGTALSFGGIMGTVGYDDNGHVIEDANGDPIFSELYSDAPQTDPGTSGSGPNPVNSTLSTETGRFSSIGTSFLSSLNMGPRPPANTPPDQLLTTAANNGTWLPNQNDGGGAPGFYGSPMPANAAFKLQGISGNAIGGANGGDGGRAVLFGLRSNLSSNNNTMPVTMSPNFNSATFNASSVNLTGLIGLVVNYNGNDYQIDPALVIDPDLFLLFFGGIATLSPDPEFPTAGFYTRSGADYIMHFQFGAHVTADFPGSNPSVGFALNFVVGINAAAKANLRPGDNNFDGIVDVSDIQSVAASYLQTGAFRPGNANGDNIVDVSDIQLIAANYLQTTPPLPGGGGGDVASVPEPASLLVLSLGALCLVAARRRLRA